MKDERIRIIDIAEELGVSTATVSNVIHGKTKKISDETVKRVQELIEKKGYIPNMAGILLAQNSSRIIGVVINDHEKYEGHVLEDGFISSALNALSVEVERAGYFLMVRATSRWNEIVQIASMWNMEGLVLMGFCDQDYEKLRDAMHIPFVVYDGYFEESERICNIIIDNYDGGFQVGRYFREMGHEKVLCISDNCICVDKERMDGCRDGLKNGQMDFLKVPMTKEERIKLYDDSFTELRKYTAVFAVSDYYAAEWMQYLQERGVRVPEEISVIGFDDSPVSCLVYPALTTVKQSAKERAKQAIRLLQELKAGTCKKTTIKLPVRLVERKSVRRLVQTDEGGDG